MVVRGFNVEEKWKGRLVFIKEYKDVLFHYENEVNKEGREHIY